MGKAPRKGRELKPTPRAANGSAAFLWEKLPERGES